MKQNRLSLSGLAIVGLVGAGLIAARADSISYDVIVEKNPFRLKPPPPPAPPEDASAKPPPPPPPATVELTGITSILDRKLALFEIIPGPGKQMIKPILGEGERVESVEVVSINVDKNEVTVKNGMVVTNLTFKIVKSTAPAAAPAPGGVPPPALPAAAPTQTSYNNYGGRGVMVGGGNTPETAAPAAPAADSGFRSIPSRNIRSSPQGDAALNRDEQYRRMEDQRLMNEAMNQAAGRQLFPPLPPTPHTPPDAPGYVPPPNFPRNNSGPPALPR